MRNMLGSAYLKRARLGIVSAVCLLGIAIPQESMAASKVLDRLVDALVETGNLAQPIPLTPSVMPLMGVIKGEPLLFGLMQDLALLAKVMFHSSDPLKVTKKFLTCYLERINAQNYTKLTMKDLHRLLRQKVDIVPREHREMYWKAIEALESDNLAVFHGAASAAKISDDEWKLIVAAFIALCITAVALFNPSILVLAGKIIVEILILIFNMK